MRILDRLPLRGGVLRAAVLVALGLVLGLVLGGGGSEPADSRGGAAPAKAQWYTCSMHPQIRLPDPDALCPICGMELIPVTDDTGETGTPRRLTMSEAARALAEVETAPVERRVVVKEVRLVGKVDYDETRQRSITAWVPGRLDRLYVDYTGVAVRTGAPLVYMYSPELLVAQESLLKAEQALAAMKASGAGAPSLAMQQSAVDALVQRLRLWGLTDEQIGEIRQRGSASDHMTILSPIAGIVIHKMAVQGDYVGTGTKIYDIADLSRVWVYLDAYESDMEWIRYAQEVEFEAEAYPGEVFRGRISFVDPFLNERTRTVKLRVTVENADGRLKPGMFVRARIHARLAEGGRIVEPYLQGKWISPVHPEIVEDGPGDCPICGTPLVSAESLGYAGGDFRPPLVVPAAAVLRTGRRAVVYVEVPGTERPTYEGREITLGPRARDFYLVAEGLTEGERVVVKGNFKIDSALQILARPSMMSAEQAESDQPRLDVPEGFRTSLSPLYHAALKAQRALAADDADRARAALDEVARAADGVSMAQLADRAHETWMRTRSGVLQAAREGAGADDIASLRSAFERLSVHLLETAAVFGQATGVPLYEAFCPMAFEGRGAAWLADAEEILNPWFGARMLHCGEVRRTFASDGGLPVEHAFAKALSPVYESLLAVQRALAADDLAGARSGAAVAARAFDGVTATPGAGWLADTWTGLEARGAAAAEAVAAATEIEEARGAYAPLAGVGLALVRRFGHARTEPLVEAFCPMAFDNKGASWLQEGEEIANPYFGERMFGCGEVRARFAPVRGGAVPAAARKGIGAVVETYLALAEALAGDDIEGALRSGAAFEAALGAVPATALEGDALAQWRTEAASLRSAVDTLRKATDLEGARRPFALLSESLARVLRRLGHEGPDDLVLAHCPMAFQNRGADWIQRGETIRNPYFGAAMLRCGDVTRRLPREPKD